MRSIMHNPIGAVLLFYRAQGSNCLSLNWTADHFPLCVFGACFWFGFGLSVLLLWVLSFCFLCFGNGIVTAAGLCTGPIPVHFCGPQPDGGYMYALIS